MTSRTLAAVLFATGLLAAPACSPTIRKPRLLHPGTAPVQQYNATQFDPFPQQDMGPEIVGGRPIDFLTPVPEQTRANQFRNGERPIELARPGTIARVPVAAPGYVQAGPGTTLPLATAPPAAAPGVPSYATAPIGGQPPAAAPFPAMAQPPATTQPPSHVRY